MTSVVVVFIDALKPDSLNHMKFLNTLYKRRIKTEMGYSNTCHASMYTGVYPRKHNNWFIWFFSPDSSPFRILSKSKIIGEFNDNSYLKCGLYVLLQKYKKGKVLAGLPLLAMHPLYYWSYFDGYVVDPCIEPCDTIGGYSTIFKILKDNSIKVFYKFCNIQSLSKCLDNMKFDAKNSFHYIFIGEIDTLSHKFGQNSEKTINELKYIDRLLEIKMNDWMNSIDDFIFILFSDHGHIEIKKEVDLQTIFKENKRNIYDYIFFIDSNYARFWFRNETEKKEVIKILSTMDNLGYILNDQIKERYKLSTSRRYGDVIFYLDKPNIFSHEKLILFGKDRTTSVVSMHGFSPDHLESDGVFVSNRQICNVDHLFLQDLVPSVLDIFKINMIDHLDGDVIWKS